MDERTETGGGGYIGGNVDQTGGNFAGRDRISIHNHPSQDLSRHDLYEELLQIHEAAADTRGDMKVLMEKVTRLDKMNVNVLLTAAALIIVVFAGLLAWYGLDREIQDLNYRFNSLEYRLPAPTRYP